MDANISSIVKELKKVSIEHVLFEAITNSIQANASNIGIYFNSKNGSMDDSVQTVDEVEVVDDGEGFDEINITSFNTYRSSHKQKLGSKGVGRFLYLKLFKQVDIYSLNNEIQFTADRGMTTRKSESSYTTTKLVLSNPTESKYQVDGLIFEQKVRDHFLPHFKLLKDDSKSVKITTYFDHDTAHEISNGDIPSFETTTFKIKDFQFNLDYILDLPGVQTDIKEYDGFYCADNRVVIKNSQLEKAAKFDFFKGVNVLFLFPCERLKPPALAGQISSPSCIRMTDFRIQSWIIVTVAIPFLKLNIILFG